MKVSLMNKKLLISSTICLTLGIASISAGIGVHFHNIKVANETVDKLVLNTFYYSNRDESKRVWEIDTLNYDIKKISIQKSGKYSPPSLTFNIDNPQGFYEDCIKPHISSTFMEYDYYDYKVRLFFYNKAPIYYEEYKDSICISSYGGHILGKDKYFLTPFFEDPTDFLYLENPFTLKYPKDSDDEKYQLFTNRQINKNIRLENYNDAKELFVKHLDPDSFLVNDEEKSISIYGYNVAKYLFEDGKDYSYWDFIKDEYIKYSFNDENIQVVFNLKN